MSSSTTPRPSTPQVLIHHLPDKPKNVGDSITPSKFIILLMGTVDVAGKVQIAKSVADALDCPYFQGESLHESSAKAASIGVSRVAAPDAAASNAASANEVRYQRMWLSKLMRTGLLFPDASRPAHDSSQEPTRLSSATTSRRGSASSTSSMSSHFNTSDSSRSRAASTASQGSPVSGFFSVQSMPVHNPVFTVPIQERRRQDNPALMVLTHPPLEAWHKRIMRNALREHKIGIIFVPLYDEAEHSDEELPVLRPLDPRTMTRFPVTLDGVAQLQTVSASLDDEMKLRINTSADIEGKIEEIISQAKDMIDM